MSDADAERKAKAARAKALLAKKRKENDKKKAGTPAASVVPSSPASTANETIPSARESLDEPRPELDDRVKSPLAPNKDAEPTAEDSTTKVEEAPVPIPPAPQGEIVEVKEDEDAGKVAGEETSAGDGEAGVDVKEEEPALPEIKPKDDETSKLHETISNLLAERIDLQDQVTKLKSSLATAEGDSQLLEEGRNLINKLEGEKAELESKLTAAETSSAKVDALEGEVKGLREEVDALRAERDELKRANEESNEVRSREAFEAKEKMDELEKSLSRAREREGGLESEVGRLRSSSNDLESKVSKLTTELESTRDSSSSTAKEMLNLQGQHDELKKSHAELQSERTTLQSTLDTLKADHEVLETKHATSSSSLSTAESNLSAAQSELSTVKGNLGNMTKRAETAEKRKEGLQAENDELVKQLAEVRNRVVEVMEEKADMTSRIQSLETRSKTDAKDLEAARAQINEHETTIASLRDTSVSDERALEISQQAAKIRELEAALHAATSRVHSLTRQLAAVPPASPSSNSLLAPASDEKRPAVQRLPSVDLLLPASVRHKRQVSLAGLKARMGPSRTLSGTGPMDSVQEDLGLIGRKQFGDEIMFCCPACEGDLITL